MKNQTLLIVMLCASVYILGCKPQGADSNTAPENSTTVTAEPVMTKQDSIKRGEYLVLTMGCHDCHSPKVFSKTGEMSLDTSKLLSGHPAGSPLPSLGKKGSTTPMEGIVMSGDITAFVGPWGTSYAANLTPDATGTGAWSFENFKTVLTKGKFKGLENGRPIMPPMPWPNLINMNINDMHMMWAYLRSVKPINNLVPSYTPPGAH